MNSKLAMILTLLLTTVLIAGCSGAGTGGAASASENAAAEAGSSAQTDAAAGTTDARAGETAAEAGKTGEKAAAAATGSAAASTSAAGKETGSAAESAAVSRGLIVIDPGHQQYANTDQEPIGPGASETKIKVSGGTSGVASGVPEYQLNLDISLQLREELERRGYTVIMVRETNEVDISNAERAAVANEADADAFVRIHANGGASGARGAMTICQTPGNLFNGDLYPESRALADCILDAYTEKTGIRYEYVWETDTMSGINWCRVPATILELGYMTNSEEDRLMQDPEMQKTMAEGIADGIDAYMADHPAKDRGAESTAEAGETAAAAETGNPETSSTAETAGAADSPLSPEMQELQLELRGMLEKKSGKWSLFLCRLDTDQVLGINERKPMISASLIKLYIAGCYLEQVEKGEVPDDYQDQLYAMLSASDNGSTNTLIDVVGMDAVNDFMDRHHYSAGQLNRKMLVQDGTENYTSARDCARVLEKVYKGTFVSQEASERILEALSAQIPRNRDKIPAGVPSDVKTANKTGELFTNDEDGVNVDVQNDAAIILAQDHPYILVVMSAVPGVGEGELHRQIADLSARVYDTLTAEEAFADAAGLTAEEASADGADPAAEKAPAGGEAFSKEADRILEGMSAEEKIAQMIIPAIRTWDGQNVTDLDQVPALAEALRRHPYGGIILFGENVVGNGQTAKLAADLQENNAQIGDVSTGIPYFMAVDEEGGIVSRFAAGTRMTGNMAIGATGDNAKENAMATGVIIGEEMAALGFNVDFAPVVDVNNNPANPVIGTRSFSDDPQLVAELGEAFAQGLAQNHIIATYKHFPGHGDTGVDSHIGTPSVNKSYEELRKTELAPFASAIENGAEMIMTAHITYPAIDEEQTFGDGVTKGFYPATMSARMIAEILRGDMGYDGVVVTDALEMDAIDEAGLVPGAEGSLEYRINVAEKIINAGVDLLLIPADLNSPEKADFYDACISALAERAADGRIPGTRIDESVRRILRLKLKYGILEPADGQTGDAGSTGEAAENAGSGRTGTAADAAGSTGEASDAVGTGAAPEEAAARANADTVQDTAVPSLETVGSDAHHLREMEIARQAVTLVKNDAQTLPAAAAGQKIVLLGSQESDLPALRYYVKLLQEEGALDTGAQITIETCLAASGKGTVLHYTDGMRRAVRDADLVIGMTRTYSLAALEAGAPQYEAIHRAIADTHEGDGRFVLLSQNLPYDAARYQDADAIVLAYMGSGLIDPTDGGTAGRQLAGNANVAAALEIIFGLHTPSGRLPVNIPVLLEGEDGTLSYGSDLLYERGFGFSYE